MRRREIILSPDLLCPENWMKMFGELCNFRNISRLKWFNARKMKSDLICAHIKYLPIEKLESTSSEKSRKNIKFDPLNQAFPQLSSSRRDFFAMQTESSRSDNGNKTFLSLTLCTRVIYADVKVVGDGMVITAFIPTFRLCWTFSLFFLLPSLDSMKK